MKSYFIISAIILFAISCKKSNTENVTISNPPVSVFTDSIKPIPPIVVQFTHPTANNYVAFFWDFGDGGYSLVSNPVHSYAAFGNYVVRLVQQNAIGGRDTINRVINTSILGYSQPISNTIFNYYVALGAPVSVRFKNQSLNSNSYLWKFGDGTTSTSNADTLSHIYSRNGTYTVTLISTGPGGSDSSSRILNLN